MYLMQHKGGLLNKPWSRLLERHYAWLQRRPDKQCGLFKCDTPGQHGKLDRGKEKKWCPFPYWHVFVFQQRTAAASVSPKGYLHIEGHVLYV